MRQDAVDLAGPSCAARGGGGDLGSGGWAVPETTREAAAVRDHPDVRISEQEADEPLHLTGGPRP